jgi:DNA topoisomerase-1
MESTALVNRHRWNTLVHKGVAFPPEYLQRGISIRILGEEVLLDRDQEELIYAWAKKKHTHYVNDIVFQTNFLYDLKKILPEKFKKLTYMQDIVFTEESELVD